MRRLRVDEGLTIRFPHRCEAFDEGVEIGLVATSLSTSNVRVRCCLSAAALEPRALGEQMGYRIVEESQSGEWTRVEFRSGRTRPELKLSAFPFGADACFGLEEQS